MGFDPDTNSLRGLQLFDKDGAVVLQTGFVWVGHKNCQTQTVHLKDGERVIGYKSRTSPWQPNKGWHYDFQLIIGRLV